ncbi:hypothetical protein KUCAC02_008163 [Chaenocephalus aceratus]|uniref:Uncharacterized protein n=1 Tax=Chaenocephalus aceratus TaxID=36190 RepID=A0ACB9X8U2_CHAAC|nr:hypothetical protein KUCAC02_008163 [Chaenocephalus aceratus]
MEMLVMCCPLGQDLVTCSKGWTVVLSENILHDTSLMDYWMVTISCWSIKTCKTTK